MISSNLFGGSRNELGPYRATRLWNDLVRTFRAGMPVGRKRRQLKVYEDAFIASDAVTWLHEYLQQNLDSGPEITRPQTVLLLQKFQRTGVIQDARGEKSNAEPLEDNGRLFCFIRFSPRKLGAARIPLTSRTNLAMPSADSRSLFDKRALCSSDAALCTVPGAADLSKQSGADFAVAKAQSSLAGARRWQSEDTVCTRACSCLLSQPQPCDIRSAPPRHCSQQSGEQDSSTGTVCPNQLNDVWKAAALELLRKALMLRSCDELPVDVNLIKGTDIAQNVTQQQQHQQQQQQNIESGSSSLENRPSTGNDSFPGWLTIAMRYLARLPKRRANCGSGRDGSSSSCNSSGGHTGGSSRRSDDLPRYPGFERDVYAMVKEYFESQPEPVIPFRFYRIFALAWARALVAGVGCGGQAAAAAADVTSSAVTPRCEPPPLPPRRRLVSKSPGVTSVIASERCMSGIREQPLLSVDASPGPLFAKLEQGPVLRAPYPLPSHDELNDSLYYTPPSQLPTGGSSSSSIRPVHSAALPAFVGRSPLDFYVRRCVSRTELLTAASKTDGVLARTSNRSRVLPFSGSLPNLAFVGCEREQCPELRGGSGRSGSDADAAAAAAAATADYPSCVSAQENHFGSGESICAASARFNDVQCAAGTVSAVRTAGAAIASATAAAAVNPFSSSRRMPVNGGLKNFTSVHDLVATVESDNQPAQHRSLSAADLNLADAFSQSCFSQRCKAAAKGSVARTAMPDRSGASATACHSLRSCELNTSQQPHSQGWLLQQQQQQQLLLHDRRTTRGDRAIGLATLKPPVPEGYKPVLSVAAIKTCRRVAAMTSGLPPAAVSAVGALAPASAADAFAAASASDPVTAGTTCGRSPTVAFGLGQAVASSPCSGAHSAAPANCSKRPAQEALSEMMHSRLLRSIQLSLLLLPPTNRRHLQILLRLLHGLSSDGRLVLDIADKAFCTDTAAGCLPSQGAREVIIGSFWRSILRSSTEFDTDETVTMMIVSFLVEHHEQVMNVPTDLTKSVECSTSSVRRNELPEASNRPASMLQPATAFGASVVRAVSLQQLPLQESRKQLQLQLMPAPGDDPLLHGAKPRPVSYCQQVTKQEYEEQRMSVSERALTELLENILADVKMTEKEKKKKLKQFQKAYPEIFLARFPTPESQPSCMKEQPKIKQPLLARPLRLLRTLR